MFNKKSYLIIFAVFIVLAVAGVFAAPMADGFSHNLPDGGCVSSVAKILPCFKYLFPLDILIGLFLLLAISLFLLIASSPALAAFFRARRRFFDNHSFDHKIKANRWLALFALV